ncbi:hypothetical protein OG205_15240 [Lentzea sp. NBC_00516]|uniref:hypothetical protein n=1 Tax=Lentzea sp. NBC_00516 TaxID=2903582 RepID=UPI002E7FBA46|nr:hypothetical protein [Lentzea sp. NBC_00516]WUD28301.1 hypothetical protein OG205_15240 [Lentzea sp. NBC_00516]
MIECRAVVEVTGGDTVALSARMSREEFDAALVAIADYGADDDAVFGPELLRALLDEEMIIMAGGVRVSDTATGVRIEPGCCVGLENWRDWADLLDGKEPWLGHSRPPGVEFAQDVVRLWPQDEHRYGPACEIPAADLREHLEGVRQDLIGFLGLVREWAPYELGEPLAAAFDEHFHISAPL